MDLALALSPVHRESEPLPPVGQLNSVNANSLATHPVVLQLTHPPMGLEESTLRSPQISALLTERMGRLVDMVDQLRSPDSGWPSDQPQTADAIAPYVLEEVEDVIAAWQTPAPELGVAQPITPTAPALPLWQDYFLLDSLEAWLVWTAARSAYETMRLLEGMSANVVSPGIAKRQGIVRLAIVLELQSPHHRWEMDLITRQAPPTLLPLDAMIHTPDYALCHPALDVGRLLQTVTTQIRTTTPEAGLFLNGVQVTSLVPEHPWQAGLLQIRLGLQFIPDAVDPVVQEAIAITTIPLIPLELDREPALPPPIGLHRLKLTDVTWRQHYRERVTQQQLASLLYRTSLSRAVGAGEPTPTTADLIEEAIALVEPLNTSLALTGRLFPLDEMTIDGWMTRLLWYFNRGSREIMQLMGGVSATCLRPRGRWEAGLLRLQPLLVLNTPESNWVLDLVTGQPAPMGTGLPGESMVQVMESGWAAHLMRLDHQRQQILRELEHMTPELSLLMDGTAMELSSASGSTQSGTVQVAVEFSFTAMSRR